MEDLRDHQAELLGVLRRIERHTSFAEVLAEGSRGGSVALDAKASGVGTVPRLAGMVVRAWGGTGWLEAAASRFDPRSLGAATEEIERALAKSGVPAEPPGESSATVAVHDVDPPRPVREMGIEAMMGYVREVFGWAMAVPGIKVAQVSLSWKDDERYYLNTAGANCFQRVCRTRADAVAVAMENGRIEHNANSFGGVGGRAILDGLTEETVRRISQEAVNLLKAKAPPTGEMNVLLDPGTTGTFAHESFGHGTEADQFVRHRSYLQPLLGEVVGPEALTIVDDGSAPGGWGSIYFDDEGHPSQRTTLVDRGRFVGAIHDRDSAAALHAKPTGNTRRADFLSRAFVRMTNTSVEPGDWTFDELVAEARDGITLERCTVGMEDPAGGLMQLKVRMGHRIEHGKITDLVSSMALSGSVLEFLRAIRGVSDAKDFTIEPGTCGKGFGDFLPVGGGGSYLLSRALVGPA